MARVAINGFGRIGRAFFRLAHDSEDLEIVAINDLGDPESLIYLLRYDSVYGAFTKWTELIGTSLRVDKHQCVELLSERDPKKLPWKELDIDIVIESTGAFESFEKARAHLTAGAKRVVITAPTKDEPPKDLDAATVLMGVNEEKLKTCVVTSNASCTTNAGSPLMSILHEAVGIEKAILNTVHGYTASQGLVDVPTKGDPRRGRAAAVNIVPSSTGAAIAVTKALPELEGKFDGIAVRVPVVAGSLVDVTFVSKKDTSTEKINSILRKAAAETRWKGIFAVTEEPIVSSDIVGSTHASIADLSFTRVVDGNLVKVLAWYDNEMGYAHTLKLHATALAKHL